MFQGLNEQQKEFLEKQWAQQKEQFMGRQKSMYNFRFRGFESEPRVLKVLPVFLEAPRYTRAYIFLWYKYIINFIFLSKILQLSKNLNLEFIFF